jgi:hypothetical protein
MEPEGPIRKRGLGAYWFGQGVPAGMLLTGAALIKHEYFFVAFGLAVAAFSGWQAMNRLFDGPCWRSLAWVSVYSLLTGSAIALCFVFRSRGAMYVLVGLAVVFAPWLATRITGERQVDP